MTDAMTPADIAAMRADALAGTQGDWSCHFGDDTTKCNCKYILADYGGMGSIATIDVCQEMQGAWGDDFGPSEVEAKANARRVARVPQYETTIIALTETNAAQAAEIERMQKALELTLQWLECDAFTRAKAVIRAAIEGTPK